MRRLLFCIFCLLLVGTAHGQVYTYSAAGYDWSYTFHDLDVSDWPIVSVTTTNEILGSSRSSYGGSLMVEADITGGISTTNITTTEQQSYALYVRKRTFTASGDNPRLRLRIWHVNNPSVYLVDEVVSFEVEEEEYYSLSYEFKWDGKSAQNIEAVLTTADSGTVNFPIWVTEGMYVHVTAAATTGGLVTIEAPHSGVSVRRNLVATSGTSPHLSDKDAYLSVTTSFLPVGTVEPFESEGEGDGDVDVMDSKDRTKPVAPPGPPPDPADPDQSITNEDIRRQVQIVTNQHNETIYILQTTINDLRNDVRLGSAVGSDHHDELMNFGEGPDGEIGGGDTDPEDGLASAPSHIVPLQVPVIPSVSPESVITLPLPEALFGQSDISIDFADYAGPISLVRNLIAFMAGVFTYFTILSILAKS